MQPRKQPQPHPNQRSHTVALIGHDVDNIEHDIATMNELRRIIQEALEAHGWHCGLITETDLRIVGGQPNCYKVYANVDSPEAHALRMAEAVGRD